jgi:hypothetical protein
MPTRKSQQRDELLSTVRDPYGERSSTAQTRRWDTLLLLVIICGAVATVLASGLLLEANPHGFGGWRRFSVRLLQCSRRIRHQPAPCTKLSDYDSPVERREVRRTT